MITGFHDLSGDPGSDPAQNLARSPGLLYTAARGGSAGQNIHTAGALLSVPAPGELVDGAASYSYSLAGYTMTDDEGHGTAAFSSDVTIRAPTVDGTGFSVANKIVTDANWDSDPGGGDLDTRFATESWVKCALVTSAGGAAAMATDSFNGWQPRPSTNPVHWAEAVATAANPEMAEGRSFRLTQTTHIPSGTVNTHSSYEGETAAYNYLASEQQLSGAYRGNAAPDTTYRSTGILEINIAAQPPPVDPGAVVRLR
jgi:hypothetical protein